MPFCLFKFVADKSYHYGPQCWKSLVKKNHVAFPTDISGKKFTKYVKEQRDAEDSWSHYEVKFIKENIETYDEVVREYELLISERTEDEEVEPEREIVLNSKRKYEGGDSVVKQTNKRNTRRDANDTANNSDLIERNKKKARRDDDETAEIDDSTDPKKKKARRDDNETTEMDCSEVTNNAVLMQLLREMKSVIGKQDNIVNILNDGFEKILDLLQTALGKAFDRNEALVDPYQELGIPFDSADEVLAFDRTLKNDTQTRRKFYNILRLQGGSTLKDFLRNALNRIMSDEAMSYFSFKGLTPGKHAFATLEMKQIIFNYCARNIQETDETKFQTQVKDWLRQAPARGGKTPSSQRRMQSKLSDSGFTRTPKGTGEEKEKKKNNNNEKKNTDEKKKDEEEDKEKNNDEEENEEKADEIIREKDNEDKEENEDNNEENEEDKGTEKKHLDAGDEVMKVD